MLTDEDPSVDTFPHIARLPGASQVFATDTRVRARDSNAFGVLSMARSPKNQS